MKTYSKCSATSPELFPSRGSICRPCLAAAQRAWNDANPDKLKASRAKSYCTMVSTEDGRARAKETKRRSHQKNRVRQRAAKYNITAEELVALQQAQQNLCAICHQPETAKRAGKVKELHVDHDHATGRVRGLLCGRCNVSIGMLDESRERLEAAIGYLSRQ